MKMAKPINIWWAIFFCSPEVLASKGIRAHVHFATVLMDRQSTTRSIPLVVREPTLQRALFHSAKGFLIGSLGFILPISLRARRFAGGRKGWW